MATFQFQPIRVMKGNDNYCCLSDYKLSQILKDKKIKSDQDQKKYYKMKGKITRSKNMLGCRKNKSFGY